MCKLEGSNIPKKIVSLTAVLLILLFSSCTSQKTIPLEAAQDIPVQDIKEHFEQNREQIEQLMIQQVKDEALVAHLTELYEAADIEVLTEHLESLDRNIIIAVVNGEEIFMEAVLVIEEQELQQFYMMGLDPRSQQAMGMRMQIRPYVIDHVVNIMLIEQQALRTGITASEEDVQHYYDMFVDQFGDEQALELQLAMIDMTPEQLRKELFRELTVQHYLEVFIADSVTPDDLVFTEKQLRAFYDSMQ